MRGAEADPWVALIQTDTVAEGAPRPDFGREVTLVMGATGGCGASMLAAGLAAALAADGTPAVLAELELERSDLAGAWGVPTHRTLDDLLAVRAELEARHLELVVHRHPSGVALLPGPGRAGAESDWTPWATTTLLARAAELGAVVVDPGRSLGAHVQAAVAVATRVIVVAPPTIAGARRVRQLVAFVAQWADRERVVLVANRGVGRDHITGRGFVRACGMAVAVELARADHEADEITAGRWPRGRRARLAGAIALLAGGGS